MPVDGGSQVCQPSPNLKPLAFVRSKLKQKIIFSEPRTLQNDYFSFKKSLLKRLNYCSLNFQKLLIIFLNVLHVIKKTKTFVFPRKNNQVFCILNEENTKEKLSRHKNCSPTI
jgi:hypothetical protein